MVQKETQHQLSLVLQDDSATEALLQLGIDFFLDQELQSWLDLEIFFETIQSAYHADSVKKIIRNKLLTIEWNTHGLDHIQDLPLSTWLTPELDVELRAVLAQAQFLSKTRIHDFVQHPLTKHITKAFVEETLQKFVQKIKVGGESNSLFGMASKSALGWASKASKGVFNGLGDQLQQHLGTFTQEFISASMDVLLDQLAHIIATDEVSDLLTQAQLDYYDQSKTKSLRQYLETINLNPLKEQSESQFRIKLERWSELIADWLSYLLEHPQSAETMGELHKYMITEFGSSTLRELIQDEDMIKQFKQGITPSFKQQIHRFAQQKDFNNWCLKYLNN